MLNHISDKFQSFKHDREKAIRELIHVFIFTSIMYILLVLLLVFLYILFDLFKENVDFYTSITVFLFAAGISYLIAIPFILWTLVERRFTHYYILIVVFVILLFAHLYDILQFIFIPIFVIYFILAYLFNWKLSKGWMITTVATILVFLNIGTVFIGSSMSLDYIGFSLNQCNNTSQQTDIDFYCGYGYSSNQYARDAVSCKAVPENSWFFGQNDYTIINGTYSINFAKANETIFHLNSTPIFYVNESDAIRGMSVKVYLKDKENEVNCLSSTRNNVYLPDYETHKSNYRGLVSYFVSLLGFCIVFIPMTLYYIRYLLKEKL